MGLAEALQDVPKGVPHVRCGVDKIRQQLDGEDLAVLNETLAKIASMPGNKRTNVRPG